MIVVLQRVRRARVLVDEKVVGAIERGLLLLLGVAGDDTIEDVDYLVRKISGLRVFEDDAGKMNLSLSQVGGAVLVVSQFTLLADCRKGRRPAFGQAAAPERALELYQEFVRRLQERGIETAQGSFRSHMLVQLENDGPVTLLLQSRS